MSKQSLRVPHNAQLLNVFLIFYFRQFFVRPDYTDTKVDAIFHFTDRMTKEQRLPERCWCVWAGYINFWQRISTTQWKFPVDDPFLKPELFTNNKSVCTLRGSILQPTYIMLPKTERTGPPTSAVYISSIIRTSINVNQNIPFCGVWSTNARWGSVITEPYSTITIVATSHAYSKQTLIDKPRYMCYTHTSTGNELIAIPVNPTPWSHQHPAWVDWGGVSPEAEFLDEIQTNFLRVSSLLFRVISKAHSWDFYFFKVIDSQHLCVRRMRTQEEQRSWPLWSNSNSESLKYFPAKAAVHVCTFNIFQYRLLCAHYTSLPYGL